MSGWNADTAAGPSGAGAVTVVEGSSFCISSPSGDIHPELTQGAFYQDTRILSGWRLTVDGQPLEPLSARILEPYRAIFVGRARRADGHADSPLVVERERLVGVGVREDITVRNYSRTTAECTVRVGVEADFADLFDVKGGVSIPDTQLTRQVRGEELRLEAVRNGRHRGIAVHGRGGDLDEDAVSFQVSIPPRGQWSTSLIITPLVEHDRPPGTFIHTMEASELEAARRYEAWERYVPELNLTNPGFERTLRRSHEDLGALRIFDRDHPGRTVVAAGAPWFMALFGRDSLLTSYMALPVDPSMARGTLETLAELQGTKVDPDTEEEPGRILHEVRLGVTAGLALGNGSAYYGTADATPLFVTLLAELDRWGLDRGILANLLPHADRALDWIAQYGDRDGDGFVEYERATSHGLINQGWKDSWDGINFADGSLAQAPIALCEVQGYVYSAYLGRAMLALSAGDIQLAAEWQQRATAFKEEFNKRFWLPDKGYYAIALDRDKRPVDSCASNMGHCLWSGIVDDDKAAQVAARLMSPEMFTGWGIRTLASDMGAYNPVSYHNGSVWPHDSAIVTAGLMRYGFVDEARRVATGLFEAASEFDGRLPELFCGFDRSDYAAPIPYPTSCSPQAWAAASPVLLMRALLRMDPCLPTDELWMDPVLPDGFGSFEADHVQLGGCRMFLAADRDDLSVDGLDPAITLRREARPAMSEFLAVRQASLRQSSGSRDGS
ncbi:amylo-alpha-1,6-glucosidase [Arthrobacter sp. I2-34]|uniref:Amylo-alpha-1,6-glucosidase n=1 Tax=Arthrobacter hankyongi TaxID=2904801 RepID=A0ABS9LDS7_9MICC|nr:glycogen debranching N-terminal domain-containing protein [Arthrobacter hankyongi]MCG2624842.1 amylo-alpha-1,6-glucosidase [Arthrobacter hankyongi]